MIDTIDLENTVETAANLLISKQLSVAFAESATAGMAAAQFSLACNAGKFLKGGLVCYDASLKSDILKVSPQLLEEFTPESMEVTMAIAEGLANLIKADIYIGITGLPCPGGSETSEKPVGTMFMYGIDQDEQLFAERVVFKGTHKEILRQTVIKIAQLLIKSLK